MHSSSDRAAPSLLRHPTARALRVLVADDIAASRLALVQAVSAFGHEVCDCRSGQATLDAVQAQRPDLVLLDLLMPDMDGYEVTSRLRQLVTDRWLPVIVTSALQGDQHFVQALTRGADDYLPRPVNPELLRARLQHYQRVLGLVSELSLVSAREKLVHEFIPDAVFTCDSQLRLCEANRAARQLLQQRGQHAQPGLSIAQALQLSTKPTDITNGDFNLTLSDGSTCCYSMSRSDWSCEGRSYVTLVLRDRSADIQVERMKDEFLATVSHELRTPLTSILGAISILDAGAAGALPAKAQPLLQMARRNGERLSRLIDDVMDLTKLEGDHMRLSVKPLQLAPLLQEMVANMIGFAQARQVSLDLHLHAPQALTLADGARLGQVVTNLLSNALKHSPAGGRVTVTLEGRAQGWRIGVQDQGPGVPLAFRERLFEKFAQADTTDVRRNQGTGLGLYISRLLVRRMGGEVALDNTAAQGARFYIDLPVAGRQETAPTLVVSRDLSQRERWSSWLLACGPVAQVADADAAQAFVQRQGSVAAVVADLAAQGLADEFFEALSRLCPRAAIVLAGGAADQSFAATRGARWVAPGHRARQDLVQAVEEIRQGRSAQPAPAGKPNHEAALA